MQLADVLAEKVLKNASKLGVDAAEVEISMDEGFFVNVRMGQLESIEHSFEKSVSIRVYDRQRVGTATTSELNEASLQTALQHAVHIAKLTNEDPCSGLPSRDALAFEYPDLDLYHPWDIEVSQAIELALEAEAKGLNFDARITNSEGVDISSYRYYSLQANTLGFIGKYKSTLHSLSCSLLASEGGDMQRADDYTVARDSALLTNFNQVVQNAAKKAIKRLNPKTIPSCKVPVIFSPRMAKGLFKHFIQAIRGANLYRKASFLVDHLGKCVFPNFINIDQRPFLLKEMGSAPFDSEGVKTGPCLFVKDGILENYILSSYSARRLKLEPNGTSGGPFNLFVQPSEQDFQSLLKQMGRGLLVTDLIGHGVNLTNGNYSRGAFGFWVENGEIQYPVSGISIAGNLKDMFLGIVAVGNDVDNRGNLKVGSVLVEEMTIAGH